MIHFLEIEKVNEIDVDQGYPAVNGPEYRIRLLQQRKM